MGPTKAGVLEKWEMCIGMIAAALGFRVVLAAVPAKDLVGLGPITSPAQSLQIFRGRRHATPETGQSTLSHVRLGSASRGDSA